MDNGASSYCRFLAGDEQGIVEIIKEYKDGLLLYLNSIVGNIYTAEEITEETFVRLVFKSRNFPAKAPSKHGYMQSGEMRRSIF